MKKLRIFIYAIVALSVFHSAGNAQHQGTSYASAKSTKKATMKLTYVETPGFVYREGNQLTGICIDIMRDFAEYVKKNKGIDMKMEFVGDGSSFSGMYNAVKSSKEGVVGLGNVTITSARKREITFSEPFITNFAILITQSTVPTLTNFDEISSKFAGLTAYTAKGTTNEQRILAIKKNYYPGMKVAYASSSPETLDKVVGDSKSFTYLDLAFYLDAVKNRKPIKRHPVGDQASEQFGFIMPLGSDWKPVFDEFFNANGGYTNSTEYKMILTKHLGDTGVKLLQAVQ